MNLQQAAARISDFADWSHTDKIKFFGWFLHEHLHMDTFNARNINACYDQLSLAKPSNTNPFLTAMERKKPKELLRSGKGFRLERRVYDDIRSKFGQSQTEAEVDSLLADLPARVPNLAERTYLDEALACMRAEAFRAAVIMTWNLVFHHICVLITKDATSMAAFNRSWIITRPNDHKKATRIISKLSDLGEELRESAVLEIAYHAKFTTKEMNKILAESLNRRNSAAHPSAVKFSHLQAQAFVDNIVTNVLFLLPQ